MKKLPLVLSALVALSASALDIPKAIYVKKGETYTKFNFGVADDLNFSSDGKNLSITGYKEVINLDEIDYITFSAPIDQTAITPASQKEKLLAIGQEAIAMADPSDQPELLNVIDRFFAGYTDANGKRHRALTDYSFPEEYWNVHAATKTIAKGLKMLAEGNPSGIRTTRSGDIDLYKISDYYGVFSVNETIGEWEKTAEADYLELRFDAKDGELCRIRLEVTNPDASRWSTPDAEIELPAEATTVIYKNDKPLATSVFKVKMVQDKSVDVSVDFDANGYKVSNLLNVVNDKIVDSVSVEINGKLLCTANSSIDGKDLLVYEQMKSDIENASERYDDDLDDYIDGDPEALFSHFIRANGNVDILGKLQVDAKLFNFVKMYNELSLDSDDDDKYIENGYGVYADRVLSANADNSIIDTTYDSTEILNRQLNYLNSYSDAYFTYDGDGKRQGFISWDIDEDTYDYEPWYGGDYYQYGYVIRDNRLIEVSRTFIGDGNGWSDWSFEMNKIRDDGYFDWYADPIVVTVKDSEVIQPALRRTHYYEITPLLMFNDLTSYKFEDFFDEDSFKDLINDYDDIVDSYLSVTGQD